MKKRIAFLVAVLFSAAVFAQDLPKIAVYVTGDIRDNEKNALGTRMLSTLINSGRYKGIERSNSFLAEIEKELAKQRSGAIDDSQISNLGRQFGIKFVCIADITPAFGEFQVSARIVNVETAEVEFIGDAFSKLQTPSDLSEVSNNVVENMFSEKARPALKTEPALENKPTPEIAAVSQDSAETAPEPAPPQAEYANGGGREGVDMINAEKAVNSPKQKPTEQTNAIPRRLDGRAYVEIGGHLDGEIIYYPYSLSGWDDKTLYEMVPGVKLFADLIYADIYYYFGGYEIMTHNAHILLKYPIASGPIKLSPLVGGSMNIMDLPDTSNQRSGDYWDIQITIGGRVDLGLSESGYATAKYLHSFGGHSSTQLFELGCGLEMGGEKFFWRPELLYRFTRKDYHNGDEEWENWEISINALSLRVGAGYKFGSPKH